MPSLRIAVGPTSTLRQATPPEQAGRHPLRLALSTLSQPGNEAGLLGSDSRLPVLTGLETWPGACCTSTIAGERTRLPPINVLCRLRTFSAAPSFQAGQKYEVDCGTTELTEPLPWIRFTSFSARFRMESPRQRKHPHFLFGDRSATRSSIASPPAADQQLSQVRPQSSASDRIRDRLGAGRCSGALLRGSARTLRPRILALGSRGALACHGQRPRGRPPAMPPGAPVLSAVGRNFRYWNRRHVAN